MSSFFAAVSDGRSDATLRERGYSKLSTRGEAVLSAINFS
jgi:hypothetical protein